MSGFTQWWVDLHNHARPQDNPSDVFSLVKMAYEAGIEEGAYRERHNCLAIARQWYDCQGDESNLFRVVEEIGARGEKP